VPCIATCLLHAGLTQCISAAAIAAIRSSTENAVEDPSSKIPASSDLLADLCAHGDEFIAAAGGRGGRGNRNFASGGNRSPRRVELGTPGTIAK
jgi:GTPase involved in cell partitioning and DNA repair